MEHQIYKEWIPLAADNDLTAHELAELKNHLEECDECRFEYEDQIKLKLFIAMAEKPEADELLLFHARQNLRDALRKERTKESVFSKTIDKLKEISSRNIQLALGGAAMIAVGIFIGYMFFYNPEVINNPAAVGTNGNAITTGNTHDQIPSSLNDIRISNIMFIDKDAADGEVEFTFEAVKPMRIKGSINDDRIKNILTYAMLNVENPGTRLNSINAIGTKNESALDNDVKSALVAVAKFDENPGVRREAIKLLSKTNSDADVKSALLYVLMNDQISGNRIEAINSLMQAQKEGAKFDEAELSMFKEKMKDDENNYIRFKAKTVLEENK